MTEVKKEIEYIGHKAAVFIPAINAEVAKNKTIKVPAKIADGLVAQGHFKFINETKSQKSKKEN